MINNKIYADIQLGRASVNPLDLCLKWGEFNFAGSHAWKAEVPPTWNFEVWGTSAFQALQAL